MLPDAYGNCEPEILDLLEQCYYRLHSEFDEVNEDGLYDVELCDLLTKIEKKLTVNTITVLPLKW